MALIILERPRAFLNSSNLNLMPISMHELVHVLLETTGDGERTLGCPQTPDVSFSSSFMFIFQHRHEEAVLITKVLSLFLQNERLLTQNL